MPRQIQKMEDLAYELLHRRMIEEFEKSPINGGGTRIEAYERGHRKSPIGSPRFHFSVDQSVSANTIIFYKEIFEQIDGLKVETAEGKFRARPHLNYEFEWKKRDGKVVAKIRGKIEFSAESKKFEYIREIWRMTALSY